MVGRARTDLINSLKQSIAGQQSFFKLAHQSSEATTKISFLIAETIAKKGKPCSGGQLVKDCLQIFTDVVFPDKKSFVENVSLSHQTVDGELMTWQQILKAHWSRDLAVASSTTSTLDESTDISDTAQLATFVRGVAKTFDVVEELLDICPLKGITTGKDVFAKVNQVIKKFKLSMNKLVGIATDGAPAPRRLPLATMIRPFHDSFFLPGKMPSSPLRCPHF